MILKRAIYLGYYLKQMEWEKFALYLSHARKLTGMSHFSLLHDILLSVFYYNISILEYFQFRFFELNKEERESWVGTGHMYEYQLRMNPINRRHILDDKTLFYKNYREFLVHTVADRQDLKNEQTTDRLLNNPSGKVVFKVSNGKCGSQVEIRRTSEFDGEQMIRFMEKKNYGLVEEFIQQHPDINKLSPSAVNTIRVITQVNGRGEVDILGCRFRISVNSPVDNMAAGNMAAPLDESTGRVSGPAVYSDITKPDCEFHPVTGVPIVGFQIPFWDEILELVKRAALKHPQNRSVGWDVVVTKNGPGLIEGNHDWCKLLWQLPVKRGLKTMIEHNHLPTTESKNIALERVN